MTDAGFTLGVHRWSFPACTVREAATIARALGFDFLDLGNSADHEPRQVAENPRKTADSLLRIGDEQGIRYRDAFLHFPLKFSTNHPDATVREQNLRVAAGYLEFAAAVGLDGVTLSPGVRWEGDSAQTALQRSIDTVRELVRLGERHGLEIRIEPHVGSVTPTPESTLAYLAAVPGLSLTLDYAHFVAQGIAQAALEPLHARASHWHLRQAGAGQGQVRYEDGEIDVPNLVGTWRRSAYGGGVCLEYVHSPWMGHDRVDCLTETVRLRDEVRRLASADPAPTVGGAE